MSSTAARPASSAAALRRLFLTLFLRGRSSRGLQKGGAPTSIGRRLALTLLFYGLFGLVALAFLRQSIFVLSIYLHAMTFLFTGTFIAASMGEILFNKEEGDILLHRPITPQQLLEAKVGVLVRVSLWLAFAFNLVGLIVGGMALDGGWLYPLVHAASLSLEALFCTALAVMVYELCLRWFGRERLDGLMTTAQVLVGIGIVVGSQLLPQMLRIGASGISFQFDAWWIALIPPAWFAGLDDAIVGSHALRSWWLALGALGGTAVACHFAFRVLARDFGAGLQKMGEIVSTRPARSGRRRLFPVLVESAPLKWWLREPVAKASFLLTAAYLVRDRDVKLRVYPSLAPILIMPILMLFQNSSRRRDLDDQGFGLAFAGAFMAIIPTMGIGLLRFSQQWQAADIFRAAPMAGPAPLCHGVRKAAIVLLGIPLAAGVTLVSWLMVHDANVLTLLLPGLIALPVFSLIPCLGGHAVPLSIPSEEAKSASRGLSLMGMMFGSMILSGLAMAAKHFGFFWWMILAESVVAVVSYVGLRAMVETARWPSME